MVEPGGSQINQCMLMVDSLYVIKVDDMFSLFDAFDFTNHIR